MPDFQKQPECPSYALLAAAAAAKQFSNGLSEPVIKHLEACDFCSAEWHFLKRVAVGPEPLTVAEIPLALRLYAQNLLPNPFKPQDEQCAAPPPLRRKSFPLVERLAASRAPAREPESVPARLELVPSL